MRNFFLFFSHSAIGSNIVFGLNFQLGERCEMDFGDRDRLAHCANCSLTTLQCTRERLDSVSRILFGLMGDGKTVLITCLTGTRELLIGFWSFCFVCVVADTVHIYLLDVSCINWLIGRDFNLCSLGKLASMFFTWKEKWMFTHFTIRSNDDSYCYSNELTDSCFRPHAWEQKLKKYVA